MLVFGSAAVSFFLDFIRSKKSGVIFLERKLVRNRICLKSSGWLVTKPHTDDSLSQEGRFDFGIFSDFRQIKKANFWQFSKRDVLGRYGTSPSKLTWNLKKHSEKMQQKIIFQTRGGSSLDEATVTQWDTCIDWTETLSFQVCHSTRQIPLHIEVRKSSLEDITTDPKRSSDAKRKPPMLPGLKQ